MKNQYIFHSAETLTTTSETAKVTLHLDTAKTIEPKITYTRFFVSDIYEEKKVLENEANRQLWYCTLTDDNFKPTINNNNITLFRHQENVPQYQLAIEKIQIKILESIEKNFKSLSSLERDDKEKKLLASLSEICRYIPDLDRADASFFVDKKTCGIGVTIKKSGTLSLLIYDEGKVEYSLACNAKYGGLFRMTGIAKTTKNKKNSEHIKALLGLIESK